MPIIGLAKERLATNFHLGLNPDSLMSSHRTEHQSADELRKARDLSLESSRPPAQVPGYKLNRFVGSGAYGEVWSAKDLKTGRKVAIKFYTRRTQADVQLLAQEVQKLVVLSNDSYVVGLLDVGWDASPPYFVMDYIESGSLEDRLKQGEPLATSEAVHLFQQIATGMMHLHAKGILHCDLKPGNVLLDEAGKPRVADFGQSRLSTEKTSALGTLFFMAPEQADMTAIPDAGWDVYGLGALLFCMLTGNPPYYSQELAKTIESNSEIDSRLESYRRKLLTAPVPIEHRQIPGVDRSLADIIDRCIAADPKKRFTSIQSVLLALRQRDLVRARRPLMLLGIIGPLLLMGVVSLFGGWAFSQALAKTKTAVAQRARVSNEYAAQLAARSASEQVDEYFRVVAQLARDRSFLDAFDEIIADKELEKIRIALADPNLNSEGGKEQTPEIAAQRALFRSHEARQQLENTFLSSRMKDPENEFPVAASWFVSDRFGNQLASVFSSPGNLTVCNNYAYRTYFHGQAEDFKKSDPEIAFGNGDLETLSKRPIIGQPHLSAVFKSKQSKTWKVAFSAPVIRYGGEVQGIVAVAVDLGNLVEFDNIPSQYVMLVDYRAGENKGTILEHPLFNKVLAERLSLDDGPPVLPTDLATTTIDLSDYAIPNLEVITAQDPVSHTESGIKFGYDQESIMSWHEVKIQNLDSAPGLEDVEDYTGLRVVAVQDYQSVLKDVETLGSNLGRLAAIGSLVVLSLVLGMLWFVNRMMRESRERLTKSFSPTMDSTGLGLMDTIAAVSHPKHSVHQPPTDGPSFPTEEHK
ncbi:MAG: serine/threonine protein kinase [Mariniblastus sp.]|jgi:serine/threonine protein kinase